MVSDQIVAVVTGSSSGIGLQTSLMLARDGFITYATMRTPERDAVIKTTLEKENLPIKVVQLDVGEGIRNVRIEAYKRLWYSTKF